ncbi:NUDIX domain protein [Rhodococcus sp. MTM3W5.2]|uniref:NUDIX domain-containing protein n=1 Tax=Rhodococcus sp. MTM3W5.2 TaxID=1805827 RepID=UPI0009794A94|nr:NUDIX hydrolase [Rhodococcus sp. MTM3W5.2]AQA25229.1 NUDIX domain protein [Rhodococcus sp. MTM3W5.2]
MSRPGEHEFETLDTRTVYEGGIITLRVDRVAMPGGRAADREVVEHYGAIAVVAVDERDRLILINQYRHPLGRRVWELPAGLLDEADEDPVDAARRELAEETGLAAERWSVLVDVAVSPGFTDEVVRVFLATGLTDVHQPTPTDEEADLEVDRVPVDEAVGRALSGEIVNATALSGILALAAARARDGGPDVTGRPADSDWLDRPVAMSRRRHGGLSGTREANIDGLRGAGGANIDGV